MKSIGAIAAAILLAVTSFMAAPVYAQGATGFAEQRRFVEDRCDRNPNWRGCDDFRRDRGNWDRDDYRRWYQWNRGALGAIGLGIFAFALGAAAANARNNSGYDDGYYDDWDEHVARCYARYRSYNEETDMYLSYNNGYQRCRL